jgi:tetratricopeptide (TPR) repeat protein
MLARADLGGEAQVLCVLAGLKAMAGRFAEARALLLRARSLFQEIGQDSAAAEMCGFFGARIETLAGDAAAAERVLQEKCRVLRRIGNRAGLATGAADLAEALVALGRHDEADRWCTLAAETGAADDAWTQVGWRTSRAKLLACGGNLAEAEVLAREAVAWVESSDALSHRAKTLLDLAEILRLDSRTEEAREAVEEALALFGRKENVAGASRAESRLAELAPA